MALRTLLRSADSVAHHRADTPSVPLVVPVRGDHPLIDPPRVLVLNTVVVGEGVSESVGATVDEQVGADGRCGEACRAAGCP